jgi:hypothetical protein
LIGFRKGRLSWRPLSFIRCDHSRCWHKADVLKDGPDVRFRGNAVIPKSMSVPDL